MFVSGTMVRPCCEFVGSISVEPGNDKLQQIKNQLINNEFPAGCIKCKTKEEVLGHSLRKLSLSEYTLPDGITPDYFDLEKLSIDTGNICNLLCLPCNGQSSYIRGVELNKISAIPIVESKADLNLQRFLDLKFANLTVSGGEPFADKVTFEFLNQLVASGRAPAIKLNLISNLTMITEDKLKFLTSNFAEVYISGSIDGVGAVNEYLRYPSKWSTIENTISMMQQFPGLGFCITTALTNLSVLRYYELLEWANSKSILDKFITTVSDPGEMTSHILPADIKRKLLPIYEKLSLDNPTANVCVEICKDETDHRDKFNQTVQWCLKHDKLRNTNLFDVFPELKAYDKT